MINILKKAVSALTAAVFVFGTMTVINAKDTEDYEKLDIAGALKITDKTDLEAPATRADLAHVGVGLMNGLGGTQSADKIYADVDGCEYTEDIYSAYISGIMQGDGSGHFDTNAQITRETAITVMGRLCGYAALERGTWRNVGFDENKLTKGVGFSNPMTIGELYKMAENCLDMEVLLRDSGGVESYSKTGKTVLEYYFDAYKDTGIVSANSVSGLISATMNSAVDTVMINNVQYDAGTTQAYKYFGLNCEFYYMERSDDDPLLLTIAKSKKAEVLNITSENVQSYEDRRYTYSAGGSRVKKSKQISKTANIVYNGKVVSDISGISFYNEKWNGEVTLIDNNGSGQYDVVFIYSYQNYIATSIDADKNIIYDSKNNTSVSLGSNDGDDYEIYIDGKRGKLSDIQNDSVISVFDSGENYKLIYACRSVLKATLESVTTDTKDITADGISYKVCNDDEVKKAEKKVGSTVTLYIDSAGKVAYIDTAGRADGSRYGVLTKMTFAEDENELFVKIFDEDGTFKKLSTGNTLKIDDKSYKIENKDDWKYFWPDNTADNRKLVEYTISEDGLLTSIRAAVDTTYNDLDNGKVYTEFRRVYADDGVHSLIYKLAGTHFVNMNTKSSLGVPTTFETEASTVVFTIPADMNAADSYYSTGTVTFKNDENVQCDMFRSTDSKRISFMIVKGDERREVDENKRILVKKVVQTVNEDDEIVIGIEGTINGNADQILYIKAGDSFKFSDGTTLEEAAEQLNSGDYITYNVNSKGEIIYFTRMFDYKTQTSYLPASVGVNTPRFIYGQVTGYKDGIVTLVENNGTEQSYKFSGNVILYGQYGQKKGTNNEIVYGKMAGLYIQESRVMETVIYE